MNIITIIDHDSNYIMRIIMVMKMNITTMKKSNLALGWVFVALPGSTTPAIGESQMVRSQVGTRRPPFLW